MVEADLQVRFRVLIAGAGFCLVVGGRLHSCSSSRNRKNLAKPEDVLELLTALAEAATNSRERYLNPILPARVGRGKLLG